MHFFSTLVIKQRGITLLELMIVVAIVALLTSIAYPSYMRYVVASKRTAASSALLQVADRQQQFFMDNKSYANDLTDLGFDANPYVIADDGSSTAGADAVYSISVSNVTATTYTLTAAPLHGQLARDTSCGSLTLTQVGAKGSSGGGDNCW
ncbi:MAG: type IV pilin protein [Gammaproteobacteria bacterium]|nr:type IV pilin protein [Gammaproteobacteria bacterium]